MIPFLHNGRSVVNSSLDQPKFVTCFLYSLLLDSTFPSEEGRLPSSIGSQLDVNPVHRMTASASSVVPLSRSMPFPSSLNPNTLAGEMRLILLSLTAE